MRAIQDRRVTAGHTAYSWPNLIFDASGAKLNGNTGIAVSSYPANNLYAPDLTFHDLTYGNPIGTRAAALVNAIIDCCRDTVGFNDWVNTSAGIEGQSSVDTYTASIFPSASSATRANYRQKLDDCKVGIRKLSTISKAVSQVSVESKEGTAETSACGSFLSCYQISGYTSSMFSSSSTTVDCSGNPSPRCVTSQNVCTACIPWDGKFSCDPGTTPGTTWYPGSDSDYSTDSGCIYSASADGNSTALTGNVFDGWHIDIKMWYGTFIGGCWSTLSLGTVSYDKATGSDPTGVYTRSTQTHGSGPASITLVSC